MNMGLHSNLFNAQQGFAANKMGAAMNKPTTGFSSFLNGATQGLNAGVGLVNAFSGGK
jgi:hypothetical protein